jgi:hypothetical protein
MADGNARQQQTEPQHHPDDQGPQLGQAVQNVSEQPDQAQLPHEPQQPLRPPIQNYEEQLRDQHRDHQQGQVPRPPASGTLPTPQEAPLLPNDDQDWFTPNRADRRGPQFPPIDLEAKSRTMALQRPTAYAIGRLRKCDYVPLWYFTDQGCQLSLCTAASNCPSSNVLSDEQLTWEQFMDANRLLCRWLIPAGWPEGYTRVLSSFFWQIENHDDKGIPNGKETLLLYQARTRKAWHDKLKVDHFFNLAKLDEKKMYSYHKEVDAKYNAIVCKAVRAPNIHP